jgi:flagellar protein FlgJ
MPAAAAAGTVPSAASNYTDVNGLAALKKDPTSPQAIRAVAQQVDALFLQMMLQSMREASADIGNQESNEMGMYQDMFDKQIALTLSQHQGLGLGSLLTRQLARTASPATVPAAPKPTPAPAVGATRAPGAAQTGSVGTPPAGLVQQAAQFVSEVMPTIRSAAQGLGVSPLGMLAQAALETGWGQRMPRTADGTPSLNLFGIKAGGGWSGAQASAATVEYTGGVATQTRTAFRAYGSVEESVEDFAGLLANSPRYREAIAGGGSAQAYVESIGRSGYASDPEYSNKLNQVLNSPTFRSAVRIGLAKL